MMRKVQQLTPEDMLFEMQVVAERQAEKSRLILSCAYSFEHATSDTERCKAVEELRRLASSEQGLVSDNIRKRCWPILLNLKARVAAEQRKVDVKSLKHSREWKRKSPRLHS